MNVIRPTYLLVLITCLIMVSCFGGPDPIEGENTYTIENTTSDEIQVVYTFASNIGSESGQTDSIVIKPMQSNRFVEFIIGAPDWTPSHVFASMFFLSTEKDTLLKMDVVDDREWVLTDSVIDHGYKVGYYHWLYKFSE